VHAYRYGRRLIDACGHVCRISILDAAGEWRHRGTGVLVRPRLVATAAHVAARPDGPHLLAELAQSVLPIPVNDLDPPNLPPAGDPRVRATLTQLVLVVDRSGVLAPFLSAAAERLPGAEPVQRALGAVRAWDTAHERLLTALARSIEAG
jgi:hypothetical protein